MPHISVIIPVFNGAKTITECVNSVIDQAFTDIEIILVNDGSSDESPQICDNFKKKDSRIIVIHQNNQGVSVARNTGIEVSRGEFILFVDCDDHLESGALEVMFSLAIKNKADMVKCAKVIQGKNGYSHIEYACGRKNVIWKGEDILSHYIKKIDYPQAIGLGDRTCLGCLFSKKLLMNSHIKFEQTQQIGEDYVFLLKCILASSVLCIDTRPLYVQSRCTDSTTLGYIENYVDKTLPATMNVASILRPFFSADSYDYACLWLPVVIIFNAILEEGKIMRRNNKKSSFIERWKSIKLLCESSYITSYLHSFLLPRQILLSRRILMPLMLRKHAFLLTVILTMYYQIKSK